MSIIITEKMKRDFNKLLKKITIKNISPSVIRVRSIDPGEPVNLRTNYSFKKYGIKPGDFIVPLGRYKEDEIGMCVGVEMKDHYLAKIMKPTIIEPHPYFLYKEDKGVCHLGCRHNKAEFEKLGFKIISRDI